ncbi:MAG: hypothetical protein WDO16_10950 [Bacteroidota bacterium]
MKEIDFKYYQEQKEGEISFSKIPTGIIKSSAFRNLTEANILHITKTGRGKTVKVINPPAYEKFLKTHFPEEVAGNSRAANISKLRNSKAVKRTGSNISFLRGTEKISVNGHEVDLAEFTRLYGLFSAYNPELTLDKLCIIENLETFLNADKIFNHSYTFLHKYGRVGIEFLKKLKANEVIVFSDYDLIGLDEYLKVKECFPGAILHVPDNFSGLFEKYSAPLREKQLATIRVKKSSEPIVIQIREIVLRSNRFLEQEILLLVK